MHFFNLAKFSSVNTEIPVRTTKHCGFKIFPIYTRVFTLDFGFRISGRDKNGAFFLRQSATMPIKLIEESWGKFCRYYFMKIQDRLICKIKKNRLRGRSLCPLGKHETSSRQNKASYTVNCV